MSSFAMHYVFGKKLDPPGPSPLRSPVSPSRPVSRFFQPPILHLIPLSPRLLSISSPPVPLPFSYHFVHPPPSPPPRRLLLFVDSVSPRRSFQLISLVLFPPPWPRRMPRVAKVLASCIGSLCSDANERSARLLLVHVFDGEINR